MATDAENIVSFLEMAHSLKSLLKGMKLSKVKCSAAGSGRRSTRPNSHPRLSLHSASVAPVQEIGSDDSSPACRNLSDKKVNFSVNDRPVRPRRTATRAESRARAKRPRR
jgi:hypothetical protein